MIRLHLQDRLQVVTSRPARTDKGKPGKFLWLGGGNVAPGPLRHGHHIPEPCNHRSLNHTAPTSPSLARDPHGLPRLFRGRAAQRHGGSVLSPGETSLSEGNREILGPAAQRLSPEARRLRMTKLLSESLRPLRRDIVAGHFRKCESFVAHLLWNEDHSTGTRFNTPSITCRVRPMPSRASPRIMSSSCSKLRCPQLMAGNGSARSWTDATLTCTALASQHNQADYQQHDFTAPPLRSAPQHEDTPCCRRRCD